MKGTLVVKKSTFIIYFLVQISLLTVLYFSFDGNMNIINKYEKVETQIDRIYKKQRGPWVTREIYVNYYDKQGNYHKFAIIFNCEKRSMKEKDTIDIWYDNNNFNKVYYIDSKKLLHI